ncbi:hypothetical protein, partial [Calditerricola satsumensis]|uniref:hypothetical protein n=1 Tax=Calditerricola satsumensis TaxID=373054 RepID=UPI001E380213
MIFVLCYDILSNGIPAAREGAATRRRFLENGSSAADAAGISDKRFMAAGGGVATGRVVRRRPVPAGLHGEFDPGSGRTLAAR